MHFIDDWEVDWNSKWDEYVSDAKMGVDDTTATYQTKFGIVEDGFNSWWQEIVNFGKWLTIDESQVAGLYKSMMQCGSEPKTHP